MAHFEPDELRVLQLSAQPLIKMLQQKEQNVLGRIRGAFRAGEKDFLSLICEYSVLFDQRKEIERSLNQGETDASNNDR